MLRKPHFDSSSSGSELQAPSKKNIKLNHINPINMSTDFSCLDSFSLSSQNESSLEKNTSIINEVNQEPVVTIESEENPLPVNEDISASITDALGGSNITMEMNGLRTLFSGNNFREDLRKWAIFTRTPLSKINSLLFMCKLYKLDVPSDPRSLLKTPRSTEIKKCQYGEYMHFGLLESLENILNKNADCNIPETLNLSVGVDDLPTYKGISITLILGCLDEINEVFIIGIYKPYKSEDKPKEDPDIYLLDFVEEMSMLEILGINCNQNNHNIEFSKLIADAVAKSKILKQAGHTGYLSCSKCWVYGAYKNHRVFYKETNCLKKGDAEQKRLSTSILKNLTGFQFITKVPLDYMHLVCLGTTKTILTLLTSSGKKFSLGSVVIKQINTRLNLFREYTPIEFVRKPESLSYLGHWKATQLRQFLLYVSYAAMIDIVPSNIFQMFLSLSIAIRILCSTKENLYQVAHTQIMEFLKEFENIFGEEYLSHNFHNLCHLRDDAVLHGPLDKFSAFKYENFMQTLLRDIRKPDKILQQIYKRHRERQASPLDMIKKDFKPVKSNDNTLVCGLSGTQYSKIRYKKMVINTKNNGDNCFLIRDRVMIIENIILKNKNYFLVAKEFKNIVNLFDQPIDCSTLNMYKCSSLSSTLRVHEISDLTAKLFRLPLRNNAFMVSQLIHFEVHDEHQ